MAAGRQLVVVTGIKEIDRRLRKLQPARQKAALRSAMRSGLKIVASATKAEAPVWTGTMKKNIKVRAAGKRRRGTIELEVRVASNDETKRTTKKGQTVFYPAVVEYGKKGTPPNPFMRRAFEATGERARKTTLAALRANVEREAAKG